MPQYRKKPVVIEAVQLTPESVAAGLMPQGMFLHFTIDTGDGTSSNLLSHGTIETLEGTMRAEVGDWIIRGVKGELYPCKPDIFAATYEAVDDTSSPGGAQ